MSENRLPPHAIYRSERAVIYLGNCGRGLPQVFEEFHPKVVLTDPPYAFWSHIERISSGKVAYDHARDIEWIMDTELWVQQWFRPLRLLMQGPDTLAWFTQNPQYFCFMLRWITRLHWPIQALLQLPSASCDGEFLVRLSDEVAMTDADAQRIRRAAALNTYGSGKSVEMMRLLLQASPPGTVFDPFCGTGSTLEAALREGRSCVGIEIDDETARHAAERIKAVEVELAAEPVAS